MEIEIDDLWFAKFSVQNRFLFWLSPPLIPCWVEKEGESRIHSVSRFILFQYLPIPHGRYRDGPGPYDPEWLRVTPRVVSCNVFCFFSSFFVFFGSLRRMYCFEPLHLLSLAVFDCVSPPRSGGCDWNTMCFVTPGDLSGAFWSCTISNSAFIPRTLATLAEPHTILQVKEQNHARKPHVGAGCQMKPNFLEKTQAFFLFIEQWHHFQRSFRSDPR